MVSMGPQSSHDTEATTRVTRVFGALLGFAALIYLGLVSGPAQDASAFLDPTWHLAALAVVFGMPIAIGVMGFFVELRVMRIALGAYTIAFSAVLLTWVPAITDSPMPIELNPWPLTVTAIGNVPAALIWSPRVAWLVLLVNSALVSVVRYLAAGGDYVELPLQDGLFTLSLAAVFTAISIVGVNNAKTLDRAASHARRTAARAASAEALAREQSKLDSLVHDELMTTLYYASTGTPELDASVRRRAVRAMAELGKIANPLSADSPPIGSRQLIERLKATTQALSGDIQLAVNGRRSLPVPMEVAVVLGDALGEAVRNSLIHARSSTHEVSREVGIGLSDRGIVVRIEDNGLGFELASVPPHRLGIAVSILQRLSSLQGGSARVESQPGQGTTVTLEWWSQ